jgi:hypothetical protein
MLHQEPKQGQLLHHWEKGVKILLYLAEKTLANVFTLVVHDETVSTVLFQH